MAALAAVSCEDMLTSKRTSEDADIHEDEEQAPAKRNHALEFDAHAPWLENRAPQKQWRTLGNRAVQPSLPLENMVSAVQDLIDPDFDPLIAILDDEPRFLKPLPARMSPEDLEFLRIRGALAIPESGLRHELLRCYIKWVHSFMPVLNLHSLLLFQAVMFVATAFVDFRHLHDAGYSTRKKARQAFYDKLRLLYSLDCEEDRVAIVQTLLLMTYWSDHANHPQRDIWDWIGLCNIQAQSIGLNRDCSSAPNMDPVTQRLRTRIWWCLYSRDRLIAMGLRRPTQVNEGGSDVPMLKLEDFDFEPYHPSVTSLFACRQLEDISHQKRLASMFVEKTKLCQSLGRVLFAQYAPSQIQFGTTTRTTITLVPRQASESELAKCSQRLESWLRSLPRDAQFIPDSRTIIKEGEDVLLLHSAMLRMLYHATISALHRPWAMYYKKEQSKARQELTNTARGKMRESALGITHIIQGLSQLDLTRFLPQSGVTVILPAIVAHLMNCKSDDPTIRETSIQNFQKCVQVLQGLKDIYPAADMEIRNIEAAVRAQSENPSTFLRVMQYEDTETSSRQSGSPYQSGPSQAGGLPEKASNQQRSQSPKNAQRPKSPERQIHSPPQPQNEKPALKQTTAQTQKDAPPPSGFDNFGSIFSLDSSVTNLDLLNLDLNVNGPTPSDMSTDYWTHELLQQQGPERSEREDPFEFSPAGQERRQPHTDITGDLDWDLGLI